MSKAILVIDMPEKCKMCQFHYPARDMYTGAFMGGCRLIQTMAIDDPNSKPDWCPLKPMPDRRKGTDYLDTIFQHPAFDHGWNACIDEICKSDNISVGKMKFSQLKVLLLQKSMLRTLNAYQFLNRIMIQLMNNVNHVTVK